MSKELNLIYEQVARRCAELALEGRAIVIGVNGADGALVASLAKGLKAHLAAPGREVALFHLESCADAEARRAITASGETVTSPELAQRYLEEHLDYPLARRTIQEMVEGKAVVVADGVFLFVDALADLFDLRVYVEAEPEQTDTNTEAQRHAALVAASFACYLKEYAPGTGADFVLEMGDPRKPRIVSAVG